MDRTEILSAVKDACVEILDADAADLSETTAFAADLDADSLALVEVVMALEDRFDLRIPEEELEDIATLGAAADLVARHISAAA